MAKSPSVVAQAAGHGAPPAVRENWLLGSTRAMRRDPLSLMLGAAQRYGDVVRLRMLLWPFYLVSSTEGVQRVLQEHHPNYNKDVIDYRLLRTFLGRGLLTDDGESWLRQRRLIQPAFHRQRLAAFGKLMASATTALLARWDALDPDGPLDVAHEMMRLTQRIVGLALFSIDLSAEAETIGGAFTTLNTLITDYSYMPFPPLAVPTPRNRRLTGAAATLESAVRAIIAARREREDDPADLLSLLLAARDADTGEGMPDDQVRDEVMTLLLAGHETTANLLAWTWYLLARHPEAERRLHDELDAVLAGEAPSVDRLAELPYTRMVLDETLRLYPPAWIITRNAIAADAIAGYTVPAGAAIILSPYVTHRLPAYWDDPDAFDPERFTPERVAARPRFAYFPFGGGPRQCIGNGFALMEAQIALATIAQRYRLRALPGRAIEPEPLITLRPHGGLPMLLERR
ncbi:MAG TPA: cytochrome P450 [Ktedonobacterales bacterium]